MYISYIVTLISCNTDVEDWLFFREKVYFDVRQERLLKVFVHLQGKEGFVFSQTNPFPVKAYVVDLRLSSMFTKAEFAISEVEYTMDK